MGAENTAIFKPFELSEFRDVRQIKLIKIYRKNFLDIVILF